MEGRKERGIVEGRDGRKERGIEGRRDGRRAKRTKEVTEGYKKSQKWKG